MVVIATRYWLDGPGIESRCGQDFCTRPDRSWGPASLPYVGYRVVPRVMRMVGVVGHTPPSSAEVKEKVVIYLHSPFEPSWPVVW